MKIFRRKIVMRKLITFPLLIFKFLLTDKIYLNVKYYHITGRFLNLRKPKTFNEKLQWLKLYFRREEFSIMADKIEAKKWVEKKIGSDYIIPTLGFWQQVGDIDFDGLPDKYVLKTNHDCGGLYICRDKSEAKMHRALICNMLNKSLKRNYYKKDREWPYKNIHRKIFAETLLEHDDLDIPDYKFFCFNGKVKFLKIDTNRSTQHHATYLFPNWTIAPFREEAYPSLGDNIPLKPKNFEVMLKLAEKLAEDLPFIRVDFYNISGKIYFGELTFYPAAGFGRIIPYEWEERIGEMIELPQQVE